MATWRRHAIYFAPPADAPLARFAAAWLGWDAASGEVPAAPTLPGLPCPPAQLTEAPRRYGFHATLKPPFRLRGSETEASLDAATAALAAGLPAFDLRLRLARIGRFLALTPETPPAALRTLADACVTVLDRFRTPPSAEEVARRRGAPLDATEERHLADWGYPYVLDRFRFHMTLTGPLDDATRDAVGGALAGPLAPLLAVPLPVREICRFAEADDGRFRIVRRFPLAAARGGPARPEAPVHR